MDNGNHAPLQQAECDKTLLSIIVTIVLNRHNIAIKDSGDIDKIYSMLTLLSPQNGMLCRLTLNPAGLPPIPLGEHLGSPLRLAPTDWPLGSRGYAVWTWYKSEVRCILQNLSGVHGLVIRVLNGSGLWLSEGLSLRVKDVDFAQRQIVARDTKGNECRVTVLPDSLPDSLIEPLQAPLRKVKCLNQLGLGQGYGSLYLPFALERKHTHGDRA